MRLIEINKKQLDDFVSQQKHSQFLQSWEWGEFQGSVLRYGLEDDGRIVFAFSMFEKKLPMNKKYFYSPRIAIKFLNQKQLEFLFVEITKILKKEKAIFWRFEPRSRFPISNFQFPISRTIDVQASKTNILDLRITEEELLQAMHQKTRYNIRLAKRKGVKVRIGGKKDFDKFWEIMNETKDRDGFRLHTREHYERMLDLDFIELIVAEFKDELISANIVSCFGDMASYLHGSSSNKQRNIMAPFAIQWFTIKRAKEKGCKYYDLNGIDENKWPGVTRFKRGFAGDDIVYPGAYDFVINNQGYIIYKTIREARRMLGKLLRI